VQKKNHRDLGEGPARHLNLLSAASFIPRDGEVIFRAGEGPRVAVMDPKMKI